MKTSRKGFIRSLAGMVGLGSFGSWKGLGAVKKKVPFRGVAGIKDQQRMMNHLASDWADYGRCSYTVSSADPNHPILFYHKQDLEFVTSDSGSKWMDGDFRFIGARPRYKINKIHPNT